MMAAAALIALPMPAMADLSEILSSGTIKIAVPESFPPFGALGADGEHEGYDVDVAKMVAENLGVELELVPVVSKQRIPFLETDRVDLVIATMGANPERAKSIWFSSAYAPFYSGAFAPAGTAISSVADLAGMKVGLTGGTLEDLELSKIAPEAAELVRFGDNAATLAAFTSGQVDVLVSGNMVALQAANSNPEMKVETKFTLKESPSFIGVKKGNFDLLQWVNVFILHKKLGGELDAISEKWLGEPLPPLPTL
jgi:polar amino acid transport system substrate-binding protein